MDTTTPTTIADAPTDAPTSKLTDLQAQVEVLTELYTQIQSLRRLPAVLVQPSIPAGRASQHLEVELDQVKTARESIHSEKVQVALRNARDALKQDASDLHSNVRREMRKRRRPPTPESPRPFVEEPQSTVLFPQVEEPTQLYRKDRLIEYLQEFNNSNSSKVQIWQKHRGLEQSNEHPTVLRFTIPDVFTAYIHLEYAPSRLGVESVTAFGPREKKAPHGHSNFVVYQSVSQQLARMIEQQADVSLAGILLRRIIRRTVQSV